MPPINESKSQFEDAQNDHTSEQPSLTENHLQPKANITCVMSQTETNIPEEINKEEYQENIHSVWVHPIIKSEIVEFEEQESGCENEDDIESEKNEEEKLKEESYSEDISKSVTSGYTVPSVSSLGSKIISINESISHFEDATNDHISEQPILTENHLENKANTTCDMNQSVKSKFEAINSTEMDKEEYSGDTHSVWVHRIIKTEIVESEEQESGCENDEDGEFEKNNEEKIKEESDSENGEDSEGGAYHLAEVSYAEEKDQDSEKEESETILGTSPDFPHSPVNCSDDGSEKTIAIKLSEHEMPLTRFLSYLCLLCGHKALGKEAFIKHTQNHAGLFRKQTQDRLLYKKSKSVYKEYFKCIICEFKSRNKDVLSKHMLDSHPSQFCYGCPKCDFRTSEFTKLRSHIGKHPKMYHCNECEYKTHRLHYMSEHYRKHTREKPYPCDICSYRSSSSTSLSKHKRIHTGETPYHCKLCDRKFKQSGHLTEHMLQHTGEKPFKCHICDYRCAYRGLIKKHIRTHSDEKPFACTVCNVRCKTQYMLTTHMRHHTGEKTYKCETCGFSCMHRATFEDHKYKHNGKLLPYECTVCKKRFVRDKRLKRHMLIHEKESGAT